MALLESSGRAEAQAHQVACKDAKGEFSETAAGVVAATETGSLKLGSYGPETDS